LFFTLRIWDLEVETCEVEFQAREREIAK